MKSSPDRGTRRIIKATQLQEKGAPPESRRSAKAKEATPSTSGHVLDVARQVARATLMAAQRDAEAIRRSAAREARRKAYAEGRSAGYNEGIAQAKADSERILQDAAREAHEIVRRAEAEVGQLACEIAAHLLGAELRLNPEIVERTVLEILQETAPTGPVSIEVSVNDYPQALQAAPTLRSALGGAAELRIGQDASLPPGGVRVSGPHGTVERNWHDGLLAISEAFEEVARRGV